MTITDEELLALVDGQLDEATAQSLRTRLANDLEAAARLRDIARSGEVLAQTSAPNAAGLETLSNAIRSGELDGAMPSASRASADVVPPPSREARTGIPTVRDVAAAQRSWATPLQVAAGIALMAVGLLAGYWGGVSNGSPQQAAVPSFPTWIVRVVDYHTLYARETVSVSKVTGDDKEHLKSRFEDVLETRIHIPNLRSRKLEFRRGQVLRFEDTPIIQLAYLPDMTGAPVALCLRKTGAPDIAPEYSGLHGMGVVRWTQRGLTYVLVGHRTKVDLMADARKAFVEIDAAGTI